MTLTKDTFDNLKDNSFEISFNPDDVSTCKLIEVKGINSFTLAEGQPEPFSIVFETQSDLVYDQNTYMVKNADMESDTRQFLPRKII